MTCAMLWDSLALPGPRSYSGYGQKPPVTPATPIIMWRRTRLGVSATGQATYLFKSEFRGILMVRGGDLLVHQNIRNKIKNSIWDSRNMKIENFIY